MTPQKVADKLAELGYLQNGKAYSGGSLYAYLRGLDHYQNMRVPDDMFAQMVASRHLVLNPSTNDFTFTQSPR